MTNTARVDACPQRRGASDRRFLAAAAALFCASAVVTVVQCTAMSAMPSMAMPGGWHMSMMWMRMPGQSWSAAAFAFTAMWTVMMTAMMLPALVPMLRRYRRAAGADGGARLDALTALVAAGYFTVWTLVGVAVYAGGATLATLAMQWPALARAVPIAGSLLVVAAGIAQFGPRKVRQLACCARVDGVAGDAANAWRLGVRLGCRCCCCCAGFTLSLLALGVMDLGVMAAVTVAISAERLAPPDACVARVTGGIVVTAGVLSALRASGFV